MSNIRNFCVISHVDHGKSTLADRLLEETHTLEKRKMRAQVLDQMDLERERGITIKMTPVRMQYILHSSLYILNLIDTPGHIDFSYEVSRAIKAVEGALLLVDASQGVQAQTLNVLDLARKSGLTIIPVVNKVDLAVARVAETKRELCELLSINQDQILETSGKTGQGVKELLAAIVLRVRPPQFSSGQACRALIFDFEYGIHQGVIIYVRVLDGSIKKGDSLSLATLGETFTALEIGYFRPVKSECAELSTGEIGYIVTGIKRAIPPAVGDTIISPSHPMPALSGYQAPRPVVWASIYPEDQSKFLFLRQAFGRLHLSDSAFTLEEESSGALGRGFRVGCLGMLHLEIVTERIKREYGLEIVTAMPTVSYEVDGQIIYNPTFFPEYGEIKEVKEPWIEGRIIAPKEYVNSLMPLFYEHEAEVKSVNLFGENRNEICFEMPLRELMRHFFDELKSLTSGFASLSYNIMPRRKADVVRLDILVAGELAAPFSRIVGRRRLEKEAEISVEKLKEHLPRQMFDFKIQAKALGRIIASRALSGMKKDVAGYLYGGDITRKMKLREKQKKGKKKMKILGTVNIPQTVFLEMMKS